MNLSYIHGRTLSIEFPSHIIWKTCIPSVDQKFSLPPVLTYSCQMMFGPMLVVFQDVELFLFLVSRQAKEV